jgi:hypothetical protein
MMSWTCDLNAIARPGVAERLQMPGGLGSSTGLILPTRARPVKSKKLFEKVSHGPSAATSVGS